VNVLQRLLHGLRLWAGALALAALAYAPAHAQTAGEKARESLVKAAFLHKFASFVEWPSGSFARSDTPLRIGVLGDEQVFQDLSELSRDRDRDGRRVHTARLAAGDSLAGVHILYLKAGSHARMQELLARVPEGVLTVADVDGAHPSGSVMSFFVEDGRVRFGVSLEAATRQKLRLSARLLSVARQVQSSLAAPARFARAAAHAQMLLF
jgi:hypothetical protein